MSHSLRSRSESSLPQFLLISTLLILIQLFVDLSLAYAAPPAKPAGSKKTAEKKKSPPKKIQKEPALPVVPLNPDLPETLGKIEQHYRKFATLEAQFTQTSLIAMTGAKKVSSGVVMVKRPNKFRWETLKPEKNLLVSDGTKYWFYTPPFEEGERGQVVEKKSREVQSELANQLMSGSFSEMKTTRVESLSENRFRLVPKTGSAGTVKAAEIEVNPTQLVIERVKLLHEGGNEVLISLTEAKLGDAVDEGFFKFTPPPGTDIIRE